MPLWRGIASFYRWREGALGNVLYPHMEGANRLLGTLNLPNTCEANVATVVSVNRPRPRPNGAAPWLSPNQPIFVGLPLMIIWTWPMVVFCTVEMFGVGFGLIFHLFWALFCLVMGLSPLGLCRMVFVLSSFAHF
jgi:hypothetical protein